METQEIVLLILSCGLMLSGSHISPASTSWVYPAFLSLPQRHEHLLALADISPGGSPIVDLLQGPFAQGAMKGRHPKMPEEEQAHSYISLQSALSRSVTTPLRTQSVIASVTPNIGDASALAPFFCRIHLVNQCLVGYFRSELRVDLHFEALRCFLFMHDGEFSHSLSLHLFNKVSGLAAETK